MSVELLRAVCALVFVLGLLGLISYVVRRYGAQWGLPTAALPGKTRRLQVIEILPLDARSKLVLVRHDQHEHLLVVGPQAASFITSVKTELP